MHDPVDEKSYRTDLGLEGVAFHGWRHGEGRPLDHSPGLSRCMSSQTWRLPALPIRSRGDGLLKEKGIVEADIE